MYFWNIDELVRTLGERDLSEREAFRYFLANWLLVTLFVSVPELAWNAWDTVGAVSSVVVTIAGCIYCFTSNGGAAGHAFLPRFMAVFWVVSIRVIVLALVLAVPIFALADWLGIMKDETTWWGMLLGVFVEVIVYAQSAAHLKRIAAYWTRLQEILAPTPSPA